MLVEENIDKELKGRVKPISECLFGKEYFAIYTSTITLLKGLFSAQESGEFELQAQVWRDPYGSDYRQLEDFREHINKCISLLQAKCEYIEQFSENGNNQKKEITPIKRKKPFISKKRWQVLTLDNVFCMRRLLPIRFTQGRRHFFSSATQKGGWTQ